MRTLALAIVGVIGAATAAHGQIGVDETARLQRALNPEGVMKSLTEAYKGADHCSFIFYIDRAYELAGGLAQDRSNDRLMALAESLNTPATRGLAIIICDDVLANYGPEGTVLRGVVAAPQ